MNRTLRIHNYGGAGAVQIDQTPLPQPGRDEVLVRVHAAGVNGLDWKIRDGSLKQVFALPLPITLGVELAGVVMATGADVTGLAIGDRVMGALGALGAYSDYVAIEAGKLARIPATLDDVQAAAIPVAAMTAWQGLFEAGELRSGQTVLIHGASGGVGGFAVQFAKRAGARVIATASAANADYLRSLGADQVIDYRSADFRDQVRDAALVLDLVGGETPAKSWQVLADGGKIVSTAAPEIMGQIPAGKRGAWLMMRPDGAQLAGITALVAAGELQVKVSEVVELDDAGAAIERNKTGHGPGKAVIKFL
jgi:N-ethylmaleimide reductase